MLFQSRAQQKRLLEFIFPLKIKMRKHTKFFLILLFCTFFPNSFCNAEKASSESPTEPRMLLNPGSSSTWDQYNTDNDFMLERNPIISAILSSALTPPTSSSSKTSKISATALPTFLEKLEKDLMQMIDEEEQNLQTFMVNKIAEFGSKLQNSSVLTQKFAEMQKKVANLQDEVKAQQIVVKNQISDRNEPTLDFDPEQAKIALAFADFLDDLITSLDYYEIVTPTLNKIQAFRNSRIETKLENRMERRSLDSGCGGVVIGNSGEIIYSPILDLEEDFSSQNCVWTLRVTEKEQISITLEQDNFSSETYLAIHSLATVPTLIFGIFSFKAAGNVGIKGPTILRHGDRSEMILDGPILFITLHTSKNPKITEIAPEFKLRYKSMGSKIMADDKASIKYNHFHYSDLDGQVDYPIQSQSQQWTSGKSRRNYQGPELATFTILPDRNNFGFNYNSTRIYIEELGIRESLFWSGCDQDSLSFFGTNNQQKSPNWRNNNNNSRYLPLVGKKAAKKGMDRYCGYTEDFGGDEILIPGSEPIFVVFKTDLILGGRGFKFSWESQ